MLLIPAKHQGAVFVGVHFWALLCCSDLCVSSVTKPQLRLSQFYSNSQHSAVGLY